MVRKAMWSAGIFCALLVLGGQTAKAQFGQMNGTVKGEDGKPYAGQPVMIDREDVKGHYEVKTDKNGKFFHAGLPLGRYSVSVKLSTGQPFQALRGIQTKSGDPATADIDLQQYKMQSEAQAAGINTQGAGPSNKLSAEQMAAIEKAAKEREEEVKKRQELVGKFDSAMQAMKDKNYDQAISEFQAAAQADPTQHVVFAQLGEAYSGKAAMAKSPAEKKEFYDKSAESYKKALDLKADDASYHNNYALALANEGKFDDAQAELGKAAQMDPTNAGRYYFNLGAILVNSNHMKEASNAFKKATEADPTFADAYYQLGVALTGMATLDAKTGKVLPVAGTVESLQKYLELAPNGPNAAAAKSLVDTMSGGVTTSIGSAPPAGAKKK